MGVPQGSNLGPLLFLLFVNDFPTCLQYTSCNLFADASAIYCCARTVNELETSLQSDVNRAIKWFHDNLLTVNINKSSAMTIGTRQRLINQCALKITAAGETLNALNETKYLGVTIDNNLSWNQHISNLATKVSPIISVLAKLKYKLTRDQLNTIYQSIIQPHFDYCISVWGHTSKCNISTLQKLQNRADRTITGQYDWNISPKCLITELGWMNINQRMKYFTTLLTYKSLHKNAPSYMSDRINIKNTTYHTRNTDTINLTVPKPIV